MIKNIPLFLKKVMTLQVFSLFFSFLSSIPDVVGGADNTSNQSAIIMVLLASLLCMGVYFILIYFCSKRKNIAKYILLTLLVLGVLAEIYALMTSSDAYLRIQILSTLTIIILDIYTVSLLLGQQAKQFFQTGDIHQEDSGSYKNWFSTVSSILFIAMIGSKFLNKGDINNHSKVDMQASDNQPADEAMAQGTQEESVEIDESNEIASTNSQGFEKLDCKDPEVISEFIDTMNNSPSALSNNLKTIDVDTDYIEEISFTENPYELQCSVTFTLNDSSEVNYLMRIYDKNGKGKMMIEGTPSENQGE
jgi:hypothetical protein